MDGEETSEVLHEAAEATENEVVPTQEGYLPIEEDDGPPITVATVKLIKFKGKYPNPGPRLVRQEFERLGFQFTPMTTPNAHCAAIWAMHMEKDEIRQLKAHQTVNWYPAMPEICIKDLLHKNLFAMQTKFGIEEFPFWPEGYEMPAKWEHFKTLFVDQDGNRTQIPYIMKPARNACGKGIRCITHPDELENDYEWLKKDNPLAQRYIKNPMLIDGHKITFRIYVLVTSWDPLRLYMYPEGLVRICSEKYTQDLESFKSVYTHVTNIAINKDKIDDFVAQVDPTLPNEGLRLVWTYMLERWKSEGHDVDKLWREIKDAAVKTFLSAEKIIQHYVIRSIPFRSNCYELVGFDFLVDQDMRPWVLEVNHAPDLEPYCSLETGVKRAVIRDMLQLVDVERRDTSCLSRWMDRVLKFLDKMEADKSVYTSPYSGTSFERAGLSKGDLYTLIDSELEGLRCGRFERLFPNADSDKYLKYLDYSNKNRKVIEYLKLKRTIPDVFEFPNYYSKQH